MSEELNFRKFHDLMPHRVREVLVVSSPYEAFILEQDGWLTERIFTEYSELNLSYAPRVTHASTGEEAIAALSRRRFDLVIAMHRLADMDVFALGRRIKRMRPGRPVILLALDAAELRLLPPQIDPEAIDKVFLWTGDVKILLAIIKYIEDRDNAEHDIRTADIQVIILVEDSVRYYSSYFAILYTELMNQSHSLIAEGLNDLHRLMRLRARPKILLASTYEEAESLIDRHRNNVLAVITDVRYPKGGKMTADAGLQLVRWIRGVDPLLPVLLQSADEETSAFAAEMQAHFINKRSPSLLLELREFLQDRLGFGDFVFRAADDSEIARASDLYEFQRLLAEIPADCLERHADQNQISIWLMARCEFDLARRIRPQTVSDFGSVENLRRELVHTLGEIRRAAQLGVVADFSEEEYDPATRFLRLYPGSLGGKARGIAFINSLLPLGEIRKRFTDGMAVDIPTTMVIGTDAFDRFLEENQLQELAYRCEDDALIAERFLAANLPAEVVERLGFLLERVDYPLAVRSSSLLEDSQFQPFAGIYATYMLPNSAPSLAARLDDLQEAIKLVYASTFFRNAKAYVGATPHRIEEEKMAVILQRVVGQRHGDRFYPTVAGVAESYNFYPIAPQRPEDGVALAVLGLGRMVMDGGQALRFSPRHPQVLPQLSSPKDALRSSQREFFALDLSRNPANLREGQEATLVRCSLVEAEEDGTLGAVASVYSLADNIIRDSIDEPGPRLVTFSNLLKWRQVPLAPTLASLVDLARQGMGGPVEVEFAVDLAEPATVYFLQVRPLVGWAAEGNGGIEPALADRDLVCRSTNALGFGRISGVRDVIFVKPDGFDHNRSSEVALEVGELNRHLSEAGRPYLLIGQGRWGSAQHSLGIPVQWAQIAGARVIVECYPRGFHVEPSQGTHFFQNITSLRIGYITVQESTASDFVDWSWLFAQPAADDARYVRHVCFEQPLVTQLDATTGRAVIAKPGVLPAPAAMPEEG